MLVEEAKIKAVEVEKKVAGADAFAEQVGKSPMLFSHFVQWHLPEACFST